MLKGEASVQAAVGVGLVNNGRCLGSLLWEIRVGTGLPELEKTTSKWALKVFDAYRRPTMC